MENEALSPEDKIADFMYGEEADETPEDDDIATGDDREVEPVDEGDDTTDDDTTDDDTEVDEGGDPEDGFVEVEYNGQIVSAPKEIAEVIQQAESLQSDYTKKTQALAEQRNEISAYTAQMEAAKKQQEFVESVKDEIKQVEQFDTGIEQARQYLRENVDSLSSSDIEKIRVTIEDARYQREELVKGLQQKEQEYQQAQEQSQTEILNKSTEYLRQKVRNWDEVEPKVAEYVSELGFTESQVNVAKTDPRQMLLAHKAMLYDQLQSKTKAAVSKIENAPKVKPRSRPMDQATKDKLSSRKALKSAKTPEARKRAANQVAGSILDRLG